MKRLLALFAAATLLAGLFLRGRRGEPTPPPPPAAVIVGGAVVAAPPQPVAAKKARVRPLPPGVYRYHLGGIERQRGEVVAQGLESDAARTMALLKNDGDWAKLDALADSEIAKFPHWPTSYAFKAIAALGRGDRDAARRLADEFERRSSGNPEFDAAKKDLRDMLDGKKLK